MKNNQFIYLFILFFFFFFSKWNSFFFGKNKIMAKALGNTAEEEYKPNLSKLAEVCFFFKKKYI